MKRPLAIVFALSLAGCTKAVTIIAPSLPIGAPVSTFTVQFARDFKPGTFRAELDGTSVTSLFVPAPVAGGTSTMKLPEGNGFNSGTPIVRSPGPLPFPVREEPAPHAPVAGPPIPPGPPGSGGSSAPVPSISVYTHRLDVWGSCNVIWCSVKDELVFFPVHIVPTPQSFRIKVGELQIVDVNTYPALASLLYARATPNNAAVRLQGGVAGAPLPAMNITSAGPFALQVIGVSDGTSIVRIEAGGVQTGIVHIVVDK
jgi:hypothetical protein